MKPQSYLFYLLMELGIRIPMIDSRLDTAIPTTQCRQGRNVHLCNPKKQSSLHCSPGHIHATSVKGFYDSFVKSWLVAHEMSSNLATYQVPTSGRNLSWSAIRRGSPDEQPGLLPSEERDSCRLKPHKNIQLVEWHCHSSRFWWRLLSAYETFQQVNLHLYGSFFCCRVSGYSSTSLVERHFDSDPCNSVDLPRIGWWWLENLVPQDSDQAWARRIVHQHANFAIHEITNKRQETIQSM